MRRLGLLGIGSYLTVMRQLVVLSLIFTLFSLPSWANFGEGQARFSSGDYKGALDVWRPLAEDGDARAQYSLGLMFEQGLGTKADLKQAEFWYDRAVQQRYVPAQAALRAVRAKLGAAEAETTKPGATPAPSALVRPAPSPYPKPLSEREQIEALVHDLLRQINLQLRTGQLTYERVQVAKTGEGFAVDIYGLNIDRGQGERLAIGDVGAQITRIGDRYYQIGFLLPATMYSYEPRFDKPAQISIGRQSNQLVWDRDLEIIVDADMSLDDFSIVDPNGRLGARIASIVLSSDLADNGGRWSGPITFSMRDVDVAESKQARIKLGEISFRTIVDGLDMERYASLSRAVNQGQQTPDQTMTALRQLLAGIAIEFRIADLTVGKRDGAMMRLGAADYRLGFSGLDRQLASINMAYQHGGLVGSPPDIPELTPRDARIRITLDRLPIETLLQVGVVAVMEYMFFGEVGAKSDVLNQLRVALTDAHSELRIDDGHFEAPKLLVTVAGILAADAQALWGLAGEVGVTIVGLDALIRAYEEKNSARGGGGRPRSFGVLLRSLGQPSADGKAFVYKFEVTREGRVLVNGQDGMPLVVAFFGG